MKKFLFILFFASSFASAQHRADKWYFGVLAALDFTGGSPVAITPSSINTNEGCSSISDSLGNLLFYTDGVTVWNRNHIAMSNGTGLMGGISATQSAVIIPLPGSSSHYYIFTVGENIDTTGFRYSEVDMTLDAGNGDVTSNKNIFILNHVTEKLTAVQHNNGTDYWVAVHEWGSDAFYVYQLTASGLQATPVVSHSGMVHDSTQIQYAIGQMKFSLCGDKLALAGGYLNKAELFSFNNSTGVVSNPVSISFSDHVYGIEFSSEGSRLYVSTYNAGGTLEQFDLSSGNATTIIASQLTIAGVTDIYALQFGPDGKIYVCKSFNSHLGVINNPSLLGPLCNYVDLGVDLDPSFSGVTSSLGLPGFPQSFFRNSDDCILTGIANDRSAEDVSLYPNPSSGNFTLRLTEPISEIIICDYAQRMIEKISSPKKDFSFGESYAPGIYFVFARSSFETKVIKAVKLK